MTNKRSLIAAIIAGIGASACCVGPLVLLSLGMGGAWIGNLTALEPYQPVFMLITLIFLGLAFRQLYLVPEVCEPDKACAKPETRRNQRIIFWVISILLIALMTFPWYAWLIFN
jgi:mercuric ion transport protein